MRPHLRFLSDDTINQITNEALALLTDPGIRVENAEVARVFTMPLSWLADKSNRWEFKLPGREYGLIVYHPYDGEILWGATAIMTDNFLKVLSL